MNNFKHKFTFDLTEDDMIMDSNKRMWYMSLCLELDQIFKAGTYDLRWAEYESEISNYSMLTFVTDSLEQLTMVKLRYGALEYR